MGTPPGKTGKREKPEVFPKNTELFRFDDIPHFREDIYEKTRKAVENSFPREYGSTVMELENLEYGPEPNAGPDEEKRILMGHGKLNRPLRATVRLRDRKTGDVLDEVKNKTVMRVPHLTDRGTFTHNGSNYTSIKQSRLLPGPYARRKDSGELEVQYNVTPGTGRSFRVRLEPETSVFRMDIGGSSLKLYSVLKDLGVPDEKMRKAWGDEVFESNRERYDTRDAGKLFRKLNRFDDPSEFTREQMLEKIGEKLRGSTFLKDIAEQNLGPAEGAADG